MTAAVRATNLRFQRGVAAVVDEMTFTVEKGRITALIGHNGAGKTTLLKLVLGLLVPSSGTIDVLGSAPGTQPIKVGYLPENVSFYDQMTVAEHLKFFADVKHVAAGRCEEVAERLRLSEIADKMPGQCSKGQRQRLGLAQALLAAPELLVLDEPTTGLDSLTAEALYAILSELAREGCAVMLTTHELAQAEKHVHDVMMLKAGRLVAGPASLAQLRCKAALETLIVLRACRPEKMALPAGVSETAEGLVAQEAAVPAAVMALAAAGCGAFDIVRPDLASLYAYFNEVAS